MHETRPDDTAPRWAYFDVSEDECSVIVHGDRRYFLLRISKHRTAFVADACPHRGGPLHRFAARGTDMPGVLKRSEAACSPRSDGAGNGAWSYPIRELDPTSSKEEWLART
jgi:hypothetical protein